MRIDRYAAGAREAVVAGDRGRAGLAVADDVGVVEPVDVGSRRLGVGVVARRRGRIQAARRIQIGIAALRIDADAGGDSDRGVLARALAGDGHGADAADAVSASAVQAIDRSTLRVGARIVPGDRRGGDRAVAEEVGVTVVAGVDVDAAGDGEAVVAGDGGSVDIAFAIDAGIAVLAFHRHAVGERIAVIAGDRAAVDIADAVERCVAVVGIEIETAGARIAAITADRRCGDVGAAVSEHAGFAVDHHAIGDRGREVARRKRRGIDAAADVERCVAVLGIDAEAQRNRQAAVIESGGVGGDVAGAARGGVVVAEHFGARGERLVAGRGGSDDATGVVERRRTVVSQRLDAGGLGITAVTGDRGGVDVTAAGDVGIAVGADSRHAARQCVAEIAGERVGAGVAAAVDADRAVAREHDQAVSLGNAVVTGGRRHVDVAIVRGVGPGVAIDDGAIGVGITAVAGRRRHIDVAIDAVDERGRALRRLRQAAVGDRHAVIAGRRVGADQAVVVAESRILAGDDGRTGDSDTEVAGRGRGDRAVTAVVEIG